MLFVESASEFDGLFRACKYSFVTNRLDYCGECNSYKLFQSFIGGPTEEKAEKIKRLFPSFRGLYAYLELIAECNGRDPLDGEVVEAYWLGNKLLDGVPLDALKKMVAGKLGAPGLLPRKIAEGKASELSGGVSPHHSLHVLHVNFMTGKVEPILPNLDKCLIQWGKVREADGQKLLVDGSELVVGETGFELRKREKSVAEGFCSGVGRGELVSIHWDFAVERISGKQAGVLERFTRKNMDFVNSVMFPRHSSP